MPLEQKDVASWDETRVETERRDRLSRIDELRKGAGGSLAAITDPEQRDEVRAKHAELNVIGERADEIRELKKADEEAQQLQRDLDEPGTKHRHGRGRQDPEQGDRVKLDLRDAGRIFATSEGLKRYREDGIKGIEVGVPVGAVLPGYIDLDVKGYRHPHIKATLGSNDALANVDTEYPPESIRVGVLVEELFQQPNIADLMPQTTIDQAAVPFMRETVNSQGAAETAEGDLAPEASLSFVEDSAPVRKIPVMIPVTEEILEDEQLVRGHVNGRLPQFVQMREDAQILRGDGTGQNLEGILSLDGIDETTTYTIADTAQHKLEAVFHCGMRIMENFLQPDASVMGLGVWETLRLAKDDMGQYLIAPATENAAPRVWGWRVVTNQNMPTEEVGNTPILVGAFAQASQVWRRRQITLEVSDSHEDNFGRGILVVKATSRLAVTHYRAGGYAVAEVSGS